jgi:hypothetical protein
LELTTTTVEAVSLQPDELVTVTVYLPAIAVVALLLIGFWLVDV